jgi:hypothetical protein
MRIFEFGDVGVILIDKLENVVSELDVVCLVREAFGCCESHVFDGSLHQELGEMLLLQSEVLYGLLRSLSVGRNLVKSSSHHTADNSLLEIIHGLHFVVALRNKVLGVGPDVLEANKLCD